jgi:hypothetical protein
MRMGNWRATRVRVTRLSVACAFLALVGCGSTANTPAPHLPGGTYTSTRYNFRIDYPAGWQASTGPQPSAIIPLTVEITKSSSRQEAGSLLSMFSISVLSISAAGSTGGGGLLPNTSSMRKITLSGMTAYADKPVQQPVPGTSVVDTHADYYLTHGAYEYQLSTDSLSNDGSSAALASMLHSFKILT